MASICSEHQTPDPGCPRCAADFRTADEDEDDARDRARFGGPVTAAMLHTALRVAAYNPDSDPREATGHAGLSPHGQA